MKITIGGVQLTVTEENRKNLETLRDFLLTNEVPFEMANFRTGENILDGRLVTKDDIDKGAVGCGTAGCAIGWAPFVVPPKEKDFLDDVLQLDEYAKRSLGDAYDRWMPFTMMFGGSWSNHDNTRQGAAYRIDVFLNLKDGDDFPFVRPQYIHNFYTYTKTRDAWLAERGVTL